jgi:hypothetical protein
MRLNRLKLNDKKTELLVIATKHNLKKLSNITMTIGDDVIRPSTSVRNLGSWLDESMTMREQVSHTMKATYYHLRNITNIRSNLDQPTCAKVINATITSRQDYHNGLLSGVHANIIKPLQRLQNHAARVLTRIPRRDHITPVLKDLR